MKIGILVWELDIPGGTQRQALCLARELAQRGDEIVVFCFRSDPRRCFGDIMSTLRVVALEKEAAGKVRGGPRLKFLERWTGTDRETMLCRAIADLLPEDLDLLNVHDYTIYPAACYWKQRTRKPVVWMMNDLPWVLGEVGRSHAPGKGVERFLNGKWMVVMRHREFARTFDSVVALDGRGSDRLNEAVGREAIVVPSGLDLDAYPWTPREPPLPGRPLRLFSNAIFFPHRRLEDIVDALLLLRDRGIPFHWRHAGTDERDRGYAKRIFEKVERGGLCSSVEFLGEVTEERLRACFQEADAFLFPNTPQTWGLAVFQAMACGTPVVVSRGAGAASVLTHAANAILVDPFSPAQIADAVGELGANRTLWESLHVEGRRFVEENIRWDLYALRMREIFARLASPDVP